ncbi:FRG domain-containing protein [Candidatus Saccharibacteria bacterium]|nr:FRG domain-containing protein [Candidatus Saccharibacteria bacterium]
MNSAVVKVNNINEYIDIMSILENGDWIFRGQQCSSWKLETKLERFVTRRKKLTMKYEERELITSTDPKSKILLKNLDKKYITSYSNEYKEIQKFKQRIKKIDLSNIETLCMMQHYGAPTRLIDFSMSLGIALFFAFEKEDEQKFAKWNDLSYEEEKRAIWCINQNNIINFHIRSNKMFKAFVKEQKLSITKDSFEEIWLRYLDFSDSYGADNFFLKEASEHIHYTDLIDEDEAKVIPIPLIGTNDRINNQNGTFLFPTRLDLSFRECLISTLNSTPKVAPICLEDLEKDKNVISVSNFKKEIKKSSNDFKIVKLIFPPEKRKDFLQLCSSFHIETSTIYPDIEGACLCVNYDIP